MSSKGGGWPEADSRSEDRRRWKAREEAIWGGYKGGKFKLMNGHLAAFWERTQDPRGKLVITCKDWILKVQHTYQIFRPQIHDEGL